MERPFCYKYKQSFTFIAVTGAFQGHVVPRGRFCWAPPGQRLCHRSVLALGSFSGVFFAFLGAIIYKKWDVEPLAFPGSGWWGTSGGRAAAGSTGAGPPP